MGDLSAIFLLFKEIILFKSHLIRSTQGGPKKNAEHTFGAPVFAPDYSATILVAKMCANSNEHSMHIRFQW